MSEQVTTYIDDYEESMYDDFTAEIDNTFEECRGCYGTGMDDDEIYECPDCGGEGVIYHLPLKLPPGFTLTGASRLV